MEEKVKSLLEDLVDDNKEKIPKIPEQMLNWALGLDEETQSAQPATRSKESEFKAFASNALLEKEAKLIEKLYNGELAVNGGIGVGFVAYGEKAPKIINPWASAKKE